MMSVYSWFFAQEIVLGALEAFPLAEGLTGHLVLAAGGAAEAAAVGSAMGPNFFRGIWAIAK